MSTQTAERISMSCFVDADDRERLFELARRHDRSVSAELRRAIREHVEREPDREEDDT